MKYNPLRALRRKGFFRRKHTNKQFIRQTVHIDEADYRMCEFYSCTMVYSGGESVQFTHNALHDHCDWRFQGAAEATLVVLRGLSRDGATEMVLRSLALPPNVLETALAAMSGDELQPYWRSHGDGNA